MQSRDISVRIRAHDDTKAAFNSAQRNAQQFNRQIRHTQSATRDMTRASRAHFGQLGHQIQDVAVQFQMGMNPLMILGQQGSQVAAIFGAGGAMIGGFVAVAAVLAGQLAPALFESAKGADELDDELGDLAGKLGEVKDGIIIVDGELAKAFEDNVTRAGIIEMTARVNELKNALSGTGGTLEQELKDVFDGSFFTTSAFDQIKAATRNLESIVELTSMSAEGSLDEAGRRMAEGIIAATRQANEELFGEAGENLSRQFGVSAETARDFAEAASVALSEGTPEAIQRFSDSLAIFQGETKSSSEEITGLAASILSLNRQLQAAEEQRKAVEDAMSGAGGLIFTEDQIAEEERVLDMLNGIIDANNEERKRKDKAAADAAEEARKKRLKDFMDEVNKEYAMMQRGAALTASVMTPLEVRNKKLEEYKKLLDAQVISQVTHNRLVAEAKELYKSQTRAMSELPEKMIPKAKSSLEQYADAAKDVNEQLNDVAFGGIQSMEDGLVGLIDGTKSAKDAFRDMAKSIVDDLIRMQIQRSITGPIAGALDSFLNPFVSTGTAGAQRFSARTGIPMFAGGRANGGPVTGNKPYLVGERGPELMIPNGSGRVMRNEELTGSGGVTVNQTINVTTGVQQTVRNEIATLMPQIANASKQAVLDARRRGGSFSAAFGA